MPRVLHAHCGEVLGPRRGVAYLLGGSGIPWMCGRRRGSREGPPLRAAPRTDPYVQHYRIRLLLRVLSAKARVRGTGAGSWAWGTSGQQVSRGAPKATTPQYLSTKRVESRYVAWNGLVVKVPLCRALTLRRRGWPASSSTRTAASIALAFFAFGSFAFLALVFAGAGVAAGASA